MRLSSLVLLFSVAAANGQWGVPIYTGRGNQTRTVAIRADGSCAVTNAAVTPRSQLELQIQMWQRYQGGEPGLDEEATPPEEMEEGQADPPGVDQIGGAQPGALPATPEDLSSFLQGLASLATNRPPVSTNGADQVVVPPPGAPPETDATEEKVGGATTAKTQTKPLTDQELTAKVREMYSRNAEMGRGLAEKVEEVVVMSNSVRTVTSQAFASLKELVSENVNAWGPDFLSLEAARLEVDTNRNLRLTFTPSEGAADNSKEMARYWKRGKFSSHWKLVLPGKVLSSDLPVTDGSTTGVDLDGTQEESAKAALKLMGQPIVITAEIAGLKLDAPLDSLQLAKEAAEKVTQPGDLSLEESHGGFQTELASLTLTTTHRFPEGAALPRARAQGFSQQAEAAGTLIQFILYPPEGRTLRSASGLKLLRAVDDQGRPVPSPAKSGSPMDVMGTQAMFMANQEEDGAGAQLWLRLGLPEPDAAAIEEIDAEVEAVTAGSWKELTLTNVSADAKTPIDLAAVLPGAQLTIDKLTRNQQQTSITARLSGPPAVEQLEVKIKTATRRGNSSMNAFPRTGPGGKKERMLNLNSYDFMAGQAGASTNKPVNLLIRAPQDLKRERVPFKLKGLDLL